MAEITKNWVARMINRHADIVMEIDKVKNIAYVNTLQVDGNGVLYIIGGGARYNNMLLVVLYHKLADSHLVLIELDG